MLGSHNLDEIFIAGLFIWSIVLDPQINIVSGEMMQKVLGNFQKCIKALEIKETLDDSCVS